LPFSPTRNASPLAAHLMYFKLWPIHWPSSFLILTILKIQKVFIFLITACADTFLSKNFKVHGLKPSKPILRSLHRLARDTLSDSHQPPQHSKHFPTSSN
jgi:hypothetical protein